MPVYKCPKCGRLVKKPKGSYYCRVCGPSALMEEVEVPEIEIVWMESEAQHKLLKPVVLRKESVWRGS
jgi:uncharacterized OB-fold protein